MRAVPVEPAPDTLHKAAASRFAFGAFMVFPGKRLVTRDGSPVPIGGRALDLLVALIEHAGQVLSKRELLSRVWPDVVVEEGSLRFHMNQLRRLLGDGDNGARYIATQVGVGYAFVAPVNRQLLAESVGAPIINRVAERTGRLPPRARLIGRDADIRLITDRLVRPQLFTIVGAGGVGKTSLAVEMAHRLSDRVYPQAHFVDLAQIEDPLLIVSAVAGALGLPVQGDDPMLALLAYLRTQKLLLLVDNCEHLAEAVSFMAETIRHEAPQVCLIATSREPLRARDEQLYRLNSLSFPAEEDSLSVEELLTFPSVRLFVERAAAGNAAFELSALDAPLVADVCRRLEGMALPIELAAMRVASHGMAATHTLLGERFSLGWAGRRTALPRQQTLRATFDWSYGLLSPNERLVFDRLGVFVGPFSQEAATQVVADAEIALEVVAETLDGLASKGLVAVDHYETTHSYRLLEMTRAYTREKITARGGGEARTVAFRHAVFYTSLLEALGTTPEQVYDASVQLVSQLGNVRSALEWSFGPHGDPGVALPLAAASAPFFQHFSLFVECRTWCTRAADLLELGYFGTPTEMELQAALGLVLMFTRGNSGAAETALLRAMEIAMALGDFRSQLRLLGRLQIFYERIGDFASSLAWAEQAIDVGTAIGEQDALAVAASLAGISHHLLGDQGRAHEELTKALEYSLPSHRSRTIYYGFDHRNRTGLALARTLWLLGLPNQAREWASTVEREAAALGHPVTHCIAFVWTLCIYIWTGDLDKAEASLEMFSKIAQRNQFGPYISASLGMRGAIAVRAGRPEQAVGWLQESLSQLHGMRYELLTTSFEIALAEGLILSGLHRDAGKLLEGTIAHCRSSGEGFALPELLRLKAGTVAARGNEFTATTEALLMESLTISKVQGARAWQLRTTLDIARLLLTQERRADARQLLLDCRSWLTEGFDTMDVRQLDLLLRDLV